MWSLVSQLQVHSSGWPRSMNVVREMQIGFGRLFHLIFFFKEEIKLRRGGQVSGKNYREEWGVNMNKICL